MDHTVWFIPHESILISNSENQIKLLFWFKKSLKELKKVEKEIQKVERMI